MAEHARNPFGVLDVPDPDGREVREFASTHEALAVSERDDNAVSWTPAEPPSIEGDWYSRWNGGAAGRVWRQGSAQVRSKGDRVYLLFRWEDERQRGLIDARFAGDQRLVGRYMNLGNPSIVRPWVGVIVDHRRIDGHWQDGRLDFRR